MPQQIIIIGAGGHAQVIADILQRNFDISQQYQPIGYLDDNTNIHSSYRLGLPVLGSIADLSNIPHHGIIIAVGNNHFRQELFNRLTTQGEMLITAIHPSAILASSVQIGKGTMICAGVVINPGAQIGDNVILNTACSIDHHNIIGSHTHIAPGVRLGGDVTIGEGTLVGIGATVMPQRHINSWCTVGAGALVSRNVSSGSTVVGVPAKILSPQ